MARIAGRDPGAGTGARRATGRGRLRERQPCDARREKRRAPAPRPRRHPRSPGSAATASSTPSSRARGGGRGRPGPGGLANRDAPCAARSGGPSRKPRTPAWMPTRPGRRRAQAPAHRLLIRPARRPRPRAGLAGRCPRWRQEHAWRPAAQPVNARPQDVGQFASTTTPQHRSAGRCAPAWTISSAWNGLPFAIAWSSTRRGQPDAQARPEERIEIRGPRL